MMRIISITLFMSLLFCSVAIAADGLAVIVNKDNAVNVDKKMISSIYLGNMTRWPGGGRTIIAYELPAENATTAYFNSNVIGKSNKALMEIWSQNVFTGKALPPIEVSTDEDVKKAVARQKSAIGYIKASAADASVRVVLTVQ